MFVRVDISLKCSDDMSCHYCTWLGFLYFFAGARIGRDEDSSWAGDFTGQEEDAVANSLCLGKLRTEDVAFPMMV